MQTHVKDPAHASLIKANQDHFDEQATKWDDDPEYARISQESYDTIIHHMGQFISSSTKVLNFGCGTGLLEAQLRLDVSGIIGIDISAGMISEMKSKIEREKWTNVSALQMDILLDNEEVHKTSQREELSEQGFDLVISFYTFHHLQDVDAIGKALMKYLKPGGYFCMIDFAATASTDAKNVDDKQHEHHKHKDELSEAAKASIGSHDGFSNSFLIDYYNRLGLKNVTVAAATPLRCDEMAYPTFIAYGKKGENN